MEAIRRLFCPLRDIEQIPKMTEGEIIKILKDREQLLYLPKGQRKNPLTRGVSRQNYKKVAGDILLRINQLSTVNQNTII